MKANFLDHRDDGMRIVGHQPLRQLHRLGDLIRSAGMMFTRHTDGRQRLWVAHSGTTSIEYCLIAAFISIMVVGWATFVGTSVSNFFTQVGNGF